MSAQKEPALDPVWDQLRSEAKVIAEEEAGLASFVHDAMIKHKTLEKALSFFLAGKLASRYLTAVSLIEIFDEALAASPEIRKSARRDLQAVVERDPSARGLAQPFLFFKGFQALQSYRVSHWLWEQGREPLALYLQSRNSEAFDVDIHPAAKLGKGIFIDHGTSVVIGETAVVGDDVSMLHEVTLGGTGKESGDRHPKIGRGVLIGAGAKILGNIRIGEGSKIAAGSVVLSSVPPHSTVAGIPAKVVGRPSVASPGRQMDQVLENDYCI
jgi:serine O-acetyltransferase